jgi:hypothetical protein
VAARATAAADWETTLAAITMAGLARATVAVGLARAALVRVRAEDATEAAASEQSLSVPSPQHRDFRDQHDEPRRFCAGAAFPAAFARAPPAVEWISCAARRHLPAPRSGRKKMSCAHEAHVSTRTARWRRPARSSRSRSRRWQAMGVERGGEKAHALPRSERLVACRQAASLETRTSYQSMASCNGACAGK